LFYAEIWFGSVVDLGLFFFFFRECPEDCREAISSLMFAASGFSELPELRELRQMFHEKYTDSLALFVNQEVKSFSSVFIYL
jgi:hypothetical protein